MIALMKKDVATTSEGLSGVKPAPVPRPVLGPGSLATWQARQVAAHIELNLDGALPMRELAAIARASNSHFSRAFKISFGCTPHSYVLERRVERAKYLIFSGEELADVALCCGLADQSHLSRVFRKVVGESPHAWRRRCWIPSDLPALVRVESDL